MQLVFANIAEPARCGPPLPGAVWYFELIMEAEPAPFEILEHPADVGFLARGRTIEELFANAALAMMSLGWELDSVGEREQREIRAEGDGVEWLLYDWLAAILSLSDAEGLILKRFQVNEISNGLARGAVWGERYDKSRHRARTYIKAVTLHQFQVSRTEGGWTARVFLDV